MANEFYGRGLSFPLTLSTAGGLRESAQVAKIEESIRIVLGTQRGERLMRPRFGCNLKSLVFAPNNGATATLARYYVEDGLRQWEPRIELFDVLVTNDTRANALIIHVNYRLRETQDLRSLVYPFYLERA